MINYNRPRFFFFEPLTQARPHIKLLFGIFIMLFSYLTVTLLSLLLALPLYSINWEELNSILASGMQNADISLIKFFQISQTFGLFIIPAILLNYLVFLPDERFISTGNNNRSVIFLLIFCTLVISIPMVSKLIEWNTLVRFPSGLSGLESWLKQMEEERNELTVRMLDGNKLQDLLFNLFMIAILPALGEEFIFRGVLQQLLAKWLKNIHIAILVSAFLFSAIHLQFYGFIPRLLLGMFFGYLFFWSKNIWWAVWAHFVNNAIAVILLFLSNAGKIPIPEILNEEHIVKGWEFFISSGLTVLLIGFVYMVFRKNRETVLKESKD